MSQLLVALLAGGLFTSVACPAQSPATPPPTTVSIAEARVRQLETQRFASIVKVDTVFLRSVLADELSHTHSDGRVDTKEAYLADLRAGQTKYYSIKPLTSAVRVLGATAVVTGTVALDLDRLGKNYQMTLRYTDVYVQRGGQWQMVAWQALKLP